MNVKAAFQLVNILYEVARSKKKQYFCGVIGIITLLLSMSVYWRSQSLILWPLFTRTHFQSEYVVWRKTESLNIYGPQTDV